MKAPAHVEKRLFEEAVINRLRAALQQAISSYEIRLYHLRETYAALDNSNPAHFFKSLQLLDHATCTELLSLANDGAQSKTPATH